MAAAAVAFLPAALSAVGTGVGVAGSIMQSDAMSKAEDARQQAMNLQESRRRREILRQANVSRATAVSNATNQGAGETSALAGGLSQVTNQAGRGVLASNQDEVLGGQVFAANKERADAQAIGAIGQGVSSLGGSFGSAFDEMQHLGWI